MPTTHHSPRNKQPYVISEINRMAREYGPGMKLPTAQQLAKQLGVSLTTLDRSLTKLEAKGIISRRQGSGIYVSNSLQDKRIGMVFGRNIFQFGSSAYYLLLLQQCEKTAEAEHQQFSFFLSPHKRNAVQDAGQFNTEMASKLKQEELDGLILCDINNDAYEQWILGQNVPAIALAPSQHFPSVGIDMDQLIKESLAHLASQNCRSVGLLGILSSHHKIFAKYAKKHGLKICQEATIYPEDETDPPFNTHEPLGREWMRICLKRCGDKKGLPDGLIITDDILARGALLHLKEKRIKPGRDINVVSHANQGSLSLEYWQDQITVAEVSPQKIINKIFALLDVAMSGKQLSAKPRKVPVKIKAATRLTRK
jgi:DNA-binding LacI/PurR family transcriptional regulator